MAMSVHVAMMMSVVFQARGRAVSSLPGIGMGRVQSVHRLEVMMMIVHMIQSAVRPRVRVR